jgi:hypothetical protein
MKNKIECLLSKYIIIINDSSEISKALKMYLYYFIEHTNPKTCK